MTSPRLLLVDDDPDLGLIVRILARHCGHALAHRSDAESAWAGLDAERPDLVLLDVNLPGASGLEFLRRIRTSPDHATQPVALFVQPALTQDIAAGWAAGADYHVSKDLVTRPDDWKHRLDEILAHLRSRASGFSLFLDCNEMPTGLGTPHALQNLPVLNSMSGDLLHAVATRATAPGPLTTETLIAWLTGESASSPTAPGVPEQVRECLVRLIDQVGCLVGRAACEAILKELRTKSRGNAERPHGPLMSER